MVSMQPVPGMGEINQKTNETFLYRHLTFQLFYEKSGQELLSASLSGSGGENF